jgi:hypothetical protein
MGDNIKIDLNQWRAGIKLIHLRTVTLGEGGALVEKVKRYLCPRHEGKRGSRGIAPLIL